MRENQNVDIKKSVKIRENCISFSSNYVNTFNVPDAAPLIGAFCLGNFAKESGVVDRLSGYNAKCIN